MPEPLSTAAAVVGGLGALFGGGAPNVRYRPYEITGLMGGVNFNRDDRTAQVSLSPEMQRMYDMFLQSSQSRMSGAGTRNPMQDPLIGGAWNQMAGIPGGASLAGNPGQMEGLGNFFMQQAQGGSNVAMPDQAFDMQRSLFGNAMGNLNAAAGFNPDALAADQYAKLRALMEPEENRQRAQLESRLFGQGRLGSTGGAQTQSSFEEAMGQNRLQAAIQSMGMGQDVANQMLNRGLMAGQGALGVTQLQDLLAGSNASRSLGFGQAAAGINDSLFGRGLALNELDYNRAGNAWSRAMDMYRMTNDMYNQDQQMAMSLFAPTQGMDAQLMSMIGMGGNLANQHAAIGLGNASNQMESNMNMQDFWSQIAIGGLEGLGWGKK